MLLIVGLLGSGFGGIALRFLLFIVGLCSLGFGFGF